MGDFNSPSPRILTRSFFPTSPLLTRNSKVILSLPSSARRSRFKIVYSVRKILVKPRLGRRRCRGIWPPSKPRSRREPEREPWPLCPRVAVLPMPLPIPRPTRLRLAVAPLGGRKVERFVGTFVPFVGGRLAYFSTSATRFAFIGSSDHRVIAFRSPDGPISN